ncbi:cupin domain-containing protein [Pseudoalteromonas sp. MTN2-4]|uniref:cupin domain-containing protein n=1 Tax=Pseudoalteromonas sp. MTN2-4 TaxID=3056555 RepID=UPI0036F1E8C7
MKRIILSTMLLVTSSSFAVTKAKKEILLDNTDVEVIRATYPAGSESGVHTHVYANRVVYFVKGGVLAITPKDTSKPDRIITVKDGQTLYMPGGTHNVKNIGDTEVIIVETEIKNSKL